MSVCLQQTVWLGRVRWCQHRRFVDFPQVIGKIIKRLHLYTIDLQDQTTLNLEIEPGFSINAELQQIKKGDIHTLAEWPEILSRR